MEALVGRRRWTDPEAAAGRQRVADVLRALEARLQRDDVRYESKGLTASIHYRGAPDPEAAREAILAALAGLPQAAGVRVTEGRQVLELRPPVAASKGTAVPCLIRRHALCAALFLGDDHTDLDAVRALRVAQAEGQVRALAVAVASAETPRDLLAEADAVVDGVAGVEALLVALAQPG
jgi:trehalose 6-phosphate phosphatase